MVYLSVFFILDAVALCLSKLLLDTLPHFEFIFKLIGSAYIIFLSFKLWTAPPSKEAKEISQRRLFLSGMLLNLSNIKVMLYFLMAYVSFLLPVYKDWTLILFFSIAMCFLASLCNMNGRPTVFLPYCFSYQPLKSGFKNKSLHIFSVRMPRHH